MINITLETIEDANKAKLENVFRNIDFNSEPNLGQTRDRNRRLNHLLQDFAKPRLDLRPSRIGKEDIIGNAYEYLIGRFAADAGKKGGEFYTPSEVAVLLAKLLNASSGDMICDPACGSGSLLIRVAKQVGSNDFALFGQESNGSTWALCRMNMFLHEMDNARIEWGNSITSPRLVSGDRLMKFNIVVANPPFSLKKWGQDHARHDPHKRFWRGIPPKSRGDYAFVTHMLETALEGEGRVGVIVPHGVLFRGGNEGRIRQKLIEDNMLEAAIGLPANLFFGTGIPTAIVVFNKARRPWIEARTDRDKHVLFIDASREFQDDKNQKSATCRRHRQDRQGVQLLPGSGQVRLCGHVRGRSRKTNSISTSPAMWTPTSRRRRVDIQAVRQEIADLEIPAGRSRSGAGWLSEGTGPVTVAFHAGSIRREEAMM